MKRLYNPVLFILSNIPDVEKNLELLMTILQATTDSIKNIKNGIDSFHLSVLKMAQSRPGQAPSQPADQPGPPAPTPQPAAKPEPQAEPAPANGPAPVIQMPPSKEPAS